MPIPALILIAVNIWIDLPTTTLTIVWTHARRLEGDTLSICVLYAKLHIESYFYINVSFKKYSLITPDASLGCMLYI